MFGVDDAIIAAGVTAAGSAYAAHASNAANSDTNAFNAAQAGAFYGQSQMFNREQATVAREFNHDEAIHARAFQERMDNTRYQRAIGDMQAAGINPMLAVSQGGAGSGQSGAASTGAASSPQGTTPSYIPMRSIMGEAAQSALQITQSNAINKKLEAETDLLRTQSAQAASTVPQNMMNTRKAEAEIGNIVENQEAIKAHVKNLVADTGKKYMETAVQEAMHALVEADIKYRAGQLDLTAVQKKKVEVETLLLDLSSNEAKAKSGFWDSAIGKSKPYVDMGGDVVRDITGAFRRGSR